jgi:hypothetical protein
LPKDRNWQHEDASELMFDDMMKEYNLDIPTQDVEFIKALIAGDGARCRSVLKSMRFELRQALICLQRREVFPIRDRCQ